MKFRDVYFDLPSKYFFKIRIKQKINLLVYFLHFILPKQLTYLHPKPTIPPRG